MEAYRTAMSLVRSSVEWLFGDIISYFKFLDFKKNLKLELSSVWKMYIVNAILRNGLTRLYGNTTSDFFPYFINLLIYKFIPYKLILHKTLDTSSSG